MRRSSLLAPALIIGFAPAMALLACKPDPEPKEKGEICDNGKDDDGDGQIDCYDDECREDAACTSADHETSCKNLIDDDGDGDIDCDDEDCKEDEACALKNEADCGDDFDDDWDGLTDCEDDDCAGDEACIEDCNDGIDNDADNYTDCEDEECKAETHCMESGNCDDGLDNDANDKIDCADPQCKKEEHCLEANYCDDGEDNDKDGLADCEDADCTDMCDEECTDGEDNDADDLVDCYDDECWGLSHCVPVTLWVNDMQKWRSNKIVNVTKTWVDGDYGGTVSTSAREATAYSVSGSLSIDRGSGPLTCKWWVEEATFTQTSMGRGKAGDRDGFGTSGGCSVESGALPQDVYIGWYPDADLRIDSAGGPTWYGVQSYGFRAFTSDGNWSYTWVVTSHTALVYSSSQLAFFYNDVYGVSPFTGYANP